MKGKTSMTTKIGLDLGYANITLSDVSAQIYREPSVAVVNKNTRAVISVGKEAEAGLGLDGPDTALVRPFKNGLLFDSKITQGVIKEAVSAVLPVDKLRCVVGVPSDFNAKQEKELFSLLREEGVNESFAVSRSVAALIGAGYSPGISAISVNIGASCTEISVLHGGEIILFGREMIGGENFDVAVKQYIYDQGDVNVSLSNARAIKECLGAVWPGKPNESIDIEGTLSLTGSKLRMTLTTEDIVGVFEGAMRMLLDAISGVVKKIPYDYVKDIFENGIILTGGGAELYGIDSLLSKILGITVTKPQDAIDCVAKGLSRINNIIPSKIRAGKNITSQIFKYYSDKNKKQ